MSSLAYYDSDGVRVETTRRGVVELVRSGVIKPSSRVEFDGTVYKASDFPSLRKIFDELETASRNVAADEPLVVVDLNEKRDKSKNSEPSDSNQSAESILDVGEREREKQSEREQKTGADAKSEGGVCFRCGAALKRGKFCPNCGADQTRKDASPNGAPLCPNCGAPTTGTPFCAKCGAALGKVFCGNCGAESTGSPFCSRCGTPFGSRGGTQSASSGDKIGFLDSLVVCFRKFADFSGRAGMGEFWFFFVWTLIFCFLTSGLALLILLIPFFAATARRLHDAGHTGWWQLLGPFHLIFCFFPSQPGPNKYGPEP